MTEIRTIGGPSAVAASLQRNRLGVISVTSFVVAAVSVSVVVSGLIPAFLATTGITSAPIFFLAVAVVLFIFADGYVAMSARIENAGAFYAFAVKGLGRPAGVGAAQVAVLSYCLLQVGLYGLFGATTATYATKWTGGGVDLPWYLWALAAWVIVGVFGLREIGVSGKVLAVLSGIEILVSLAISLVGLFTPGPGGIAWGALAPANLTAVGAGAAFALTATGYVGFEIGAAYGEEARDRVRTVRRSTFVVLGGIAVVYVLASLAMVSHWGLDQVANQAGILGTNAFFDMAPGPLAETGRALLLTSIFAGMLAFHNTFGRYLFSIGRERVLPAAFGEAGRRSGAPWVASVVQSLVGFIAIVLFAGMNWDPMINMFYWLGTTGGFGVLALLAITSASVVGYFARNRYGESWWRRLFVPAVGGVALAVMVGLAVHNYAGLLGVAPDAPVAKLLPGGIAVVFVVGVVVALVNRSVRPNVYAGIGLGPRATLMPAEYQPTSVRVA